MNKPAMLHDVTSKIRSLRSHRVLLSTDLAELYGVEVRALVQAVKRNLARFPDDFMFQLTPDEAASLKSQIVSRQGSLSRGNRRQSMLN